LCNFGKTLPAIVGKRQTGGEFWPPYYFFYFLTGEIQKT